MVELDPIARAQRKKALAKNLGVPMKAIDEALKHYRAQDAGETEKLAPPAPVAAAEAVAADELLDEVRSFIAHFVVVDEHALTALTLWVAFTHCFSAAETSPRLALLSPAKRCGKTRVLEVLELLCPRAGFPRPTAPRRSCSRCASRRRGTSTSRPALSHKRSRARATGQTTTTTLITALRAVAAGTYGQREVSHHIYAGAREPGDKSAGHSASPIAAPA